MKNYIKTSFTILLLVIGATNISHAKDKDVTKYSIRIENGKFTPSTINAPANKKIKLLITNKGANSEQFKSDDLQKAKLIRKADRIIKSKKRATVTIKPMKKGIYKFYSAKSPKTAIGKIIVK